jgi:peptide-methionine (S)-S-oxide reductase
MADTHEIATLGAGCFWCVEAAFDDRKGVQSVESGYTGGRTDNPTYDDICGGDTGHAEVVRVTFDPRVVSYADILRVFFTVHDPTTLNRQGNDVGTQYRSAIFYHSPEQKSAAEAVIAALDAEQLWEGHIVTQVVPAGTFYVAEDYHQEYFANNPNQPYCMFVVAPKVAKFRKQFLERLKK